MAKTKKKAIESKKGKLPLSSQFGYTASTQKGRNKPMRITFDELRGLSYNNNIVRVCINKWKHIISRVQFIVRAKDETRSEELQPQIDFVAKLLTHPNTGTQDTFRTFMSKIVEDIAVIDNGIVEKVRNAKGDIVELYQVDGSTIRPNFDEFGCYTEPAFYQYVDGGSANPDVEFGLDDLMLFQMNPQGQNGRIGYGMSPVESIAMTVTASLQAALFNQSYFDENKIPPAVINLPEVPMEELMAFKAGFEQQLQGKPWSNAFTNSKTIDIKQLRPSNADMQFYELNKWLATIICAAFEMSPQEIGLTMDINRATGEVQDRITRTQGIANMLSVISETINHGILDDLAQRDPKFAEIEFDWEDIDKLDDLTQAQIDDIYLKNGKTYVNEVRLRDGQDPVDWGDKPATQQQPGMGMNPFSGLDFSGLKTSQTNDLLKSRRAWGLL